MIFTSWEIACIEYALADYKNKAERKDLKQGAKSAYAKITAFVKLAESIGSNAMGYAAKLEGIRNDIHRGN